MRTPDFFQRLLQPLAILFLLLGGCTTPPPQAMDDWMPEGLYKFECDIINQDNLAGITHGPRGLKVQLLGDFEGEFTLALRSERRVEIVRDRMDYPGLKRSFKGEGEILQPGVAGGTAITWVKSIGPIGRDHREGPWSLRPATEQEIRRYQNRRERLRSYREHKDRS